MKPYNTTDLDPEAAFERHVFHRDMFAHYLRWSHILKEAKPGESIVDFGCGKGSLLEVLYRNMFTPSKYVGIDIRGKTIKKAAEKFGKLTWVSFIEGDLLKDKIAWKDLHGDKVCSFEVLEHVGKQNVDSFLTNFLACGGPEAVYYLSTPCYDPIVGAAGNHTYDSLDGRGVSVQEFDQQKLLGHLNRYFDIIEMFGTFASIDDYKPHMNSWQLQMFEALRKYYDSNLLSNLMAPMFPNHSRNCLYVMRRKDESLKLF